MVLLTDLAGESFSRATPKARGGNCCLELVWVGDMKAQGKCPAQLEETHVLEEQGTQFEARIG